MHRLAILALFAIFSPALSADLVLIERASPGLNPYMKSSYVSLYTADLRFVKTLRAYPLTTGGTPSAALMAGGALYVAELGCTLQGCAPRIVRYDDDGRSVTFAGPTTRVTSIRLSPRGELVVATEKEIFRLDRFTGGVLSEHPLPLPETSFIADVDVDRSGCRVAAAIMYPNVIMHGNVCERAPVWTLIPIPGSAPNGLRGIRFLGDGSLLAGTKTIYLVGRDGVILRSYDAGESGGCLVEVDRNAPLATVACASYMRRLDLGSGELSERRWIQHGIEFVGLASVEPEPAPVRVRRRVTGRASSD